MKWTANYNVKYVVILYINMIVVGKVISILGSVINYLCNSSNGNIIKQDSKRLWAYLL